EASLPFIHWVMRSPRYRHHVVATATGTTVKHTSPSRICEYEFALPPLFEQRRIAGVLGALDDKINGNSRLSQRLLAVGRCHYRAEAESPLRVGDVCDAV